MDLFVGMDNLFLYWEIVMNWVEDQVSWNMKTGCYAKHINYEGVKLIIVYHRIYEDVCGIDEIQTLDGQNIIDMVRDRAIETLEKMIAKEMK